MLLEIKKVSFEVTTGEGLGGVRCIFLKCAHTPNPYTTKAPKDLYLLSKAMILCDDGYYVSSAFGVIVDCF